MSSTDFIAVSSLCVFGACFLVNMFSQGVRLRAAVAGDPTHVPPIAPQEGGFEWNFGHFVAVVLMLVAWTVLTLETPYVKNIYQAIRPTSGQTATATQTPPPASPPAPSPVVPLAASIPDPVGFTFDSAKGQLVPPASGMPADYVPVVRYQGGTPPLAGDYLVKGVVLDATLRIPTGAKDIELQLWHKATNAVTGWAPVTVK